MRQLLTLVLIISCLSSAAMINNGQQTCQLSLKQEFSYDPYPDTHAEAVNALLLHIAEGAGKLRVRTSFAVHIDLIIQMERVHMDTLLARTAVKNVNITGDKHYKDFSLENIMIPDNFSADMRIMDKHGDVVFSSLYQNQKIDLPVNEWPKHVFHFQGEPSDLTVKFDLVSMYYEENMVEHIAGWHEALLSYYDASAYLQEMANEINTLNPDDPNTLLLDEFKLCELEAMLGEILHAPFHNWLDLEMHDPEEVISRFNSIQPEIENLRKSFNDAIAELDSLYYEKGKTLVAGEDWATAREAFSSAVHYNPFHIPSHLALSEADLMAGDHLPALQRLAHIIADMQPLHAYDAASVQLADTLLNIFFKEARELIEADRLTSSLDTLNHVRAFCSMVENHYTCPEKLYHLVDTSHQGIYRSFLTIARRAVRNDDVRFARMYIESALEYQESYHKHIPEASEAKNMLLHVMTRQRVLADIALLGGNYDVSGDYRVQTVTLAADHPGLFSYVYQQGDKEQLKAAAINFAVAGLVEESLSLLKKLRDMGVKASDLSYHQRTVAAEAAVWLGNINPDVAARELLRELTDRDPWFRVFDQTFLARW